MNCNRATTLLSAYLDEELTSNERQALRAHLHGCAACTQELAAERRLKAMLVGLRAAEPPADLEERLIAKVLEAPQARREFAMNRLMPAAAACFALGFCGWFVYSANAGSQAIGADAPRATAQFEISRDQAYAAGSDLSQPVPVVLTSSNGLR